MCAEAKNIGVSCMSGAAVAMNAILSKCHSLELERVGRGLQVVYLHVNYL